MASFDQLKAKYQSVIDLAKARGVSLKNVNLEGEKLLIRGAAPNQDIKNEVWNQIKADVLGVPYRALQGSEFGTWGAAMIAGKAAGIFTDLSETASAHARPGGETLHPNLKDHTLYQEIVKKHIAWQAVLKKGYA